MRVSPRFAQAKAPFFYVANLAVRIIVCLIHLNELSSNMHTTQDINFDITTKGAKVHFESYTTLILSPSFYIITTDYPVLSLKWLLQIAHIKRFNC